MRFLDTKKSAVLAAVVTVLCGTGTQTHAAGFYIQEQSVSGMGTAFAGQSAIARDASILHFNPAGLTHLDGAQANFGIHFLYPHTKLDDLGTTIGGASLDALGRPNNDGGNPGSLSDVPNFYFATPIDDEGKWWIGGGLSAPFGLKTEYEPDFFGRYLSRKSEIRTIDIQPTIAYQPYDWLSVGGTFITQYIRANLKQSLADETGVSLVGDDISFGYQVGVMLSPFDGTNIGLTYRSEINHNARGLQSTATGVALGPDSNALAKIKLPDIASLSIAQDVTDRLTLLASLNYFGWSNFDELRVIPDNPATVGPVLTFNYQDSFAYALGFDYDLNEDWILRAGYQFDKTPTRDEFRSTLNPDGDRHWIAGGATYKWDDQWSFDLSATYIDIEEEEINQTRAGPTNVVAKTQDAYVGIVSFGVNYKF